MASDQMLHRELHNCIHKISIGILQGSNGFVAGDVSLRHDQLDILFFQSSCVQLNICELIYLSENKVDYTSSPSLSSAGGAKRLTFWMIDELGGLNDSTSAN